MTSDAVPEIEAGWALFLDLDGTLLDLAPTPDSVVVPPGLPGLLEQLAAALGGALAVVTGRARETADRLLRPWRPAGGFSHGAELRDAVGHLLDEGALASVPPSWAARLEQQATAWPGTIVESKPHGVALHFRAAPQFAEAARAAVEALVAGRTADFEVLPAHMAFEIRPRGVTKARPVEVLMASPPFLGRRPVFVGDDVTDEDGMAVARRLGGLGLHVGRDFRGGAAEVRAWIARGQARLVETMGEAIHARA